jgi:N-acetylglucosamine malate deacetylase 1
MLSSTEWQTPGMLPFIPSVFVEISDHLKIKQKVLEAYRDEMHQQPRSRSIQNLINLASVRGSSVGLESAKA